MSHGIADVVGLGLVANTRCPPALTSTALQGIALCTACMLIFEYFNMIKYCTAVTAVDYYSVGSCVMQASYVPRER